MRLVVRSIKIGEDDLEQVSQLLIRNGLSDAKYATCAAAWRFQYIENPNNKCWASVLADEDATDILGHIGLIPLPLILNSEQLLTGAISNGVIDSTVRNKLLPHNRSKSFPIIPLIDACCKNAFKDGAKLIFAFSSIHSSIWKALSFKTIDVEIEESWHLCFSVAYQVFVERLQALIRNRWISWLIKPYAFLLTLRSQKFKFIQLKNIANTLKKEKLEIVRFEYFNETFDALFDEFERDHNDIVMYRRSTSFLNWRFANTACVKYQFIQMGKLIGYCVLRKDGSSDAEVYLIEDFMILQSHLQSVSSIFSAFRLREKLSFRIQHYLSCAYSFALRDAAKENRDTMSLSPLHVMFGKSKNKTSLPIYVKANNETLSQGTQKSISNPKNWFVEKLYFSPVYEKSHFSQSGE